ncbi:unknown protein [Paenibacillus amylolyticus]|uniref:Uncharacterized protein n=1 Tax=Paenibacillus amylolyticus TaxID=1451 RepID=A0A124DYC3_PAEAM|nr:unknown protein [Paenibacillus amylolyticus]
MAAKIASLIFKHQLICNTKRAFLEMIEEPAGDSASFRECIFLLEKSKLESPVTGGFKIGIIKIALKSIYTCHFDDRTTF